MHPQIAALVLAGLACSPQAKALLSEIEARDPALFNLLPAVLADPDTLRVSRLAGSPPLLPPCDVSRVLLLLCGCASLQVSGAVQNPVWPACVNRAAAVLPWWLVERVLGRSAVDHWPLLRAWRRSDLA